MSSIDKAERLMLYVFALLSLPQKMRQREITSGEVLISDMALESYTVRIPDGRSYQHGVHFRHCRCSRQDDAAIAVQPRLSVDLSLFTNWSA